MKKLIMSAIIALGLAVGFGFTSVASETSVSECDDCATNANSVSEFARNVRDEHIESDNCTEDHMLCEMCDGYFCDNLTCWCGSEMSHIEECWCEDHFVCEECDELFCMSVACECDETNEVSVVMTYDELMIFDEMIWDMYCEEYCINECEECDSYYYKECMCESCGNDCYECLHYDYEIFVMDYYDMIMDIYEEVLEGLEDSRANEVSVSENELASLMCEF